jgi:hypothetical protein
MGKVPRVGKKQKTKRPTYLENGENRKVERE